MKHCFMSVSGSCNIGSVQIGPGRYVTEDEEIANMLLHSPMLGVWFYEVPDIEEVKKSLSSPASAAEANYEEPIAIDPIDGVTDIKAEEDAVQANIDAMVEDIQRDLDIEQANIDRRTAIPNPRPGEVEMLAKRQERLDAKQAALDEGKLEEFDNTPKKKKPGRPKKKA